MTVDLERGYTSKEPCGLKQYLNLLRRSIFMIYVGIDVAKDKHDCFVTSSDGKVLFPVFTIQNNREGFDDLFSKIQSVSSEVSNIKVGLEATGHYRRDRPLPIDRSPLWVQWYPYSAEAFRWSRRRQGGARRLFCLLPDRRRPFQVLCKFKKLI